MVMSTVQSALDLCIYAGRYSLCLHPLNARRWMSQPWGDETRAHRPTARWGSLCEVGWWDGHVKEGRTGVSRVFIAIGR